MLELYHSTGTAFQKALTWNANTLLRRTGLRGVSQKTIQPNASDGLADIRTSPDLIEYVVPAFARLRKIWTSRRSGRSRRLDWMANQEGIHKIPSAPSVDQWDRIHLNLIQIMAALHSAAVLR